MTAPPVLAEAFVRSRDGRSILDWDGVGSAKRLVADPDRMHSAVATLEGLGFTVDDVEVTVTFRGAPEAFAAAFGVQIVVPDPSDDGGARVLGGGFFAVAPDGPLGSMLHRVVLRAPSAPTAREVGEWPLAPNVVTGQDLVLGEIWQTLLDEPPGWPATRTAFPATDAAAAAAGTSAALQRWEATDLHRQLREHLEWLRGFRNQQPPVHAVIVERSAPEGLRTGLRTVLPTLRPEATAPADLVSPVGPRPKKRAGTWPDNQRERHCLVFFRDLAPGWIGLVDAAEALADAIERGVSSGSVAGILDAEPWTSFRARLSAFLTTAAEVRRDPIPSGVDLFDAESDRYLAITLQALHNALTAGDLAGVGEYWADVGPSLMTAQNWVLDRERWYRASWHEARRRLDRHGAMVTHALLAVTLDDVPVTVHQCDDLARNFWTQRFPVEHRRTVVSGSFARSRATITAAAVQEERATAVFRLTEPSRAASILNVVAVGNNNDGNADRVDAPSLDAVFAADADNVLVVGGCIPDPAAGWVPTAATHGYEIAVPAAPDGSAPAHRVRVPHVCATTMGKTGGSVVFPDTEPGTGWWTGSGSSLATPIVAAVCALVWSAFPDLVARQVKQAVLDGAVRLGKGAFHRPKVGDHDIDDGSEEVAPPGGWPVGRVSLAGALAVASTLAPPPVPAMLVAATGTGS